MKISVAGTFLVVSASALAGMLLGGLFGYAAGHLAPEVFIFEWKSKPNEPVGTAVLLGAFGGVMCGGFLGVFAIVASLVWLWLQLNNLK